MSTAVPTDRERAAVQAYLRLLHTVRAAFGSAPGPHGASRPPVVPPAVLAEAEQALAEAGLSGNEEAFFRLLHSWCPPIAVVREAYGAAGHGPTAAPGPGS